MDLAAINIARGRDFGLGTLNQTREALGFDRYQDFSEITDDPGTLAALKEAFASVDEIDLWTGGLAEKHASGALVGETFQAIIAQQFEALRDGDRLWYENQGFDAKTLDMIENTTLADIILRDTDTKNIQDDVFVAYDRHSGTAGGIAAEDPDAPQLVIGADGRDTLMGGPQGDYLFAGKGSQVLTGGEGSDKFVVGSGTKARITDFEVGVDQLVIRSERKNSDPQISSKDGNAVVDVAGTHVELAGVTPDQILAADGAIVLDGEPANNIKSTAVAVADNIGPGATSTAEDASQAARIAMLNQFMASSFVPAGNGDSGTATADLLSTQQPLLTQPNA